MAIPQGAGGGSNTYKKPPSTPQEEQAALRADAIKRAANVDVPPGNAGYSGGGYSSGGGGGTASNRSHSDYFGGDQAYADAIMAKEASGGTLSDPAAAAAFKAANPHLFGGVGGGTSSGGAKQAPSVGASQADEREALLQMYAEAIQGSTDALNAAEKARWEQQIIAIERAYNKALDDQVTAGRQADSDKSAAETMINENTYKQNELANVMMEQRGVSSSQQGVGMAQSVHSQANKSRTNVQIAYDDRVASIAQRISSLNLDKSLDIASADSVYGSNIAINEASARADIAGKQFDVGYEDYRSSRDFERDKEMVDHRADADIRTYSEKMYLDLQSLVNSYTPGTDEFKVRQGGIADDKNMYSYKSNVDYSKNRNLMFDQVDANVQSNMRQWDLEAQRIIEAVANPDSAAGKAHIAQLEMSRREVEQQLMIDGLVSGAEKVVVGGGFDWIGSKNKTNEYSATLKKIAAEKPEDVKFIGNVAFSGNKSLGRIPALSKSGSNELAELTLDGLVSDGKVSGGVADYIESLLRGGNEWSTYDAKNGVQG